MDSLGELFRRLLFLLRANHFNREMEEEIRFHLEERSRRNLDGANLEATRLAARRRFGNVALVREQVRDAWGWAWFDHLRQDVKFALRSIARAPVFFAVVVLTLTLAIGANTAVFSVARQLLYRQLDVPHPEQLRLLGWTGSPSTVRFNYGTNLNPRDSGMTSETFSYAVFKQLKDHDRSLAGLFAFKDFAATASIAGSSQRLRAVLVSDNYYQVLGVEPQLGRSIRPADGNSGAGAVAVISDGCWERQFGRSQSVLGQTIVVNHAPLTIIGVNPRGFTGTRSTLQSPDLFVPLSLQPQIDPFIPAAQSILSDPTMWMFDVMGRLGPGQNEDQVRSALNVELAAAVRSTLTVRSYESVPQIVLVDGARGLRLMDRTFRKPISVLFVLVGFVLMLACANIANLLLARATSRSREIATRVALGANRTRVIRQLLTESLVLAMIGGSCGLLLGYLGRNLLPRLLSSSGQQSALLIHFDWSIWFFSAAVTLVTGILFGLAPALSAGLGSAGGGLQQAVANSPRSWTGIGKVLVVVQIALSALLVMGAGLFLRTLADLNSLDVGFQTENLLLATIDTPRESYPGVKSVLLHQRIHDAMAVLPGIDAVTSMELPWLTGDWTTTTFLTEYDLTHPGNAEDERINTVGNEFFAAMGIPIVAGRAFERADTAGSPPVAIINQALARSRFPGQNPVGKRFTFSHRARSEEWIEIVGIVGDTKYQDLRETPPPQYFVPSAQQTSISGMTYVVRSRLDTQVLIRELRRAVASVDSSLPITEIRTQQEQIHENMRTESTLADLTSGFGALALSLAIVGIYGVMLGRVEQRRTEIGVRLAMGAQPRQVRNTILEESALLALTGISIGLVASQAFTHVVRSILYGTSPRDPLTLSIAAALLLLVALAAAWIPARRAASLQPMEVLRHE